LSHESHFSVCNSDFVAFIVQFLIPYKSAGKARVL